MRAALPLIAVLPVLAACGPPGGADSLGAKALQNLTPFEKRVLVDKHVSLGELQQADQIYVNCLTTSGVTVLPDQGVANDPGPDGYGLTWTYINDSQNNKMNARAAVCQSQVAAVTAVWVLQHEASADQVAAAEGTFPNCAKRAGLSFAPQSRWEDVARQAETVLNNVLQSNPTSSAAPTSDPNNPGLDVQGLGRCVDGLSASTATALPGLQSALDALNTGS